MNLSSKSKSARAIRAGLLFASALFTTKLTAQTTIGLAPGMVIQEFKAGQPLEMEFVLSNGTGAPMDLRGSVTDWWYNANNEKLFDAPSNAPYSAANWIEVVPRVFQVPAKSTAKFKIIVTPPANAAPGGHYAAVFVESKPELTQQATAEHKALYTNIRMGALILLTTESTATYDLDLSNAVLTPPTDNHGLKVDAVVENRSNTHVFPQVQLAVLDQRNQVVAKAQGETKRFLPRQKDHVTVNWDGVLAPGNYNAILTLIYGDGKVRTQDFKFRVPS